MRLSSIISLSFLAFFVVGCATAPTQIDVDVSQRQIEAPEPPSPSPMDLQDVRWEACGNRLCVTPRDFERIQNNNLEAARFIRSQREQIRYYQNLNRTQPSSRR
jgi:hypothetical protein